MIVWKLDEVLRIKGVKGRELARRMAIGENYLSRVRHEVPDRLSLTLLDGLCRELGCGIADLLEYRPEPGEAPIPPPAATPRTVRRPRGRVPAAPAATPDEGEEDFQAIVAEALGAAFDAGAEPATQTRWAAEPVPEAHLPPPTPAPPVPPAPVAPEPPAAPAPGPVMEEPAATEPDHGGAAVVRTSALSAKLGRLRQRRGL